MKRTHQLALLGILFMVCGCSKQSQVQPAATSREPSVAQALVPAAPEAPATPQPAPLPKVSIAGKYVMEVCTPIPENAPPGPDRAYAVAARIEFMQRVEFVGTEDSYEMRVLETYDGKSFRKLSKPIIWKGVTQVGGTGDAWVVSDPERAPEQGDGIAAEINNLDSALAIGRGSQLNFEKANGEISFLVGIQTRTDSLQAVLSVFWPDPDSFMTLQNWYALHQTNTEWNTCFAIDSGATY